MRQNCRNQYGNQKGLQNKISQDCHPKKNQEEKINIIILELHVSIITQKSCLSRTSTISELMVNPVRNSCGD